MVAIYRPKCPRARLPCPLVGPCHASRRLFVLPRKCRRTRADEVHDGILLIHWVRSGVARAQPHRQGGEEVGERYAIETMARPEGLKPPTTWFEVTASSSTFQLEQSLATLAAFAKPT